MSFLKSLSGRTELKKPRAILFDHDGVLVASEPMHAAAWNRLLVELGHAPAIQNIHQMVGKPAPQILSALLDQFEPGWDAARLPEYVQRKNDYFLEEAKNHLMPYPGVREGLEWLRDQGIRTGVVSNARRRELHLVLKSLGLSPFFDTILSREDVGVPKPDPTAYLFGASVLECEPGECFAIEDSPTGMEAALLARIPLFGVTTTFSAEALRSPVPGRPDLQPLWIGASIAEFFELLRTLA